MQRNDNLTYFIFPAKILASLLLFLFCATVLFGQSEKWLERGDEAFAAGDYPKAIAYYEWAARKDDGFRGTQGVADSYRALKNYKAAEEWYAKVVLLEGSPTRNYFYYGQALMAQGKYDEADPWFRKYGQAAPNDPQATLFANVTALARMMQRDTSEMALTRLSFNAPASDFSPMLYKDGLLFCSARRNELGVIHTSTIDNAPLIDLFYATQKPDGKWRRAESFTALNTKFNEGPTAIDTLTGTLYFTRNDPDFHIPANASGKSVKRRGLNKLRIYSTRLVDGKWSEPKNQSFNGKGFATGHPALADGGERLYFASDRPGGMGGTDIWMVEKQGGAWSEPLNLGKNINTPGDEMFPYVHADGTLYFSSDGHLGLGGLDLFKARAREDGSWRRVVNMGLPFNSSSDDFGIVFMPDGLNGYLSSNRGGKLENDDIYQFQRTRPDFDCQPQQENIYCYRFYETGSFDPDTLPLIYEWDMGDGTRLVGLEVEHCFAGPGTYTVQLNLIDTISDFVFLNEATYDFAIEDIEQVFIDGPDTVLVGQEFELNGLKSVTQNCQIRNYYWEFGDGTKGRGERVTHTYLATGTYELRLGVEGDRPEISELCTECVTRPIYVMEEAEYKAITDSAAEERARQEQNNQDRLDKIDNARSIQEFAESVYDLKDSLDAVYRVRLQQSDTPLDVERSKFQGLRDVREFRLDGKYTYTYGEEKTPEAIYSKFRDARKKGFEDAVVIAFHGEDSVEYRTIPAKIEGDRVTIFSGEIKDDRGNALEAEITLEDLEKGLKVDATKTDDWGRFRVELPSGKLYGYYIEADDHYPVSNHIDLREVTIEGKPRIVMNEVITMHTFKQIFEQGLTVRINNVFFDYDSDVLRVESFPELDRLARILIENSDLSVEIMGHTDDRGSDAYNQRLSQKRANAVVKYLIMSGFDTNKITATGYGEAKPAVPNDTPEGRQLNRRVEFRFVPK